MLCDSAGHGPKGELLAISDEDWHNRPVPNMKFMIYLDPLRKDSGALRVIPGTHRRGDSFAEGVQDNDQLTLLQARFEAIALSDSSPRRPE